MSLAQRAQLAYAQAAIPVRSPRNIEYDAFSRISHRLRNAALARRTNFPAFVAAISENRKLWTTLAMDVSQPENSLPADLKARIFWLAEFTESESRRLLKGSGDVAILIEINAAIMHGLRGKGPDE